MPARLHACCRILCFLHPAPAAFFPAIPQYPGKQLERKVFYLYKILILFILC